MRIRPWIKYSVVIVALLISSVTVLAQTGAIVLPLGVSELTCVEGAQSIGDAVRVDALHLTVECIAASTPTATHTHTPIPPTSTPALQLGWHAPGTHNGLNVHEHGDPPPAWVLSSGHPPFTQSRESHTGYKGALDSLSNGVESYLITHVLSTVGARSHGDHDYQLWILDLSGNVSYWEGVMDFGSPPPLRTSDNGQRPIILSVGDGSCETWYSRPGSTVMDVGWTICRRYAKFDGTILGGNGTFRTADWVIPAARLAAFPGAAPTLAQDCIVEFGVCRFRFLVNSRDYNAPGIVPIN